MTHIAIVNQSPEKASDVADWVTACSHQLRYNLAPRWGITAPSLAVYQDVNAAPQGAWLAVLVKDADQAGALGYHEQNPTGLPVLYAFTQTSRDAGENPSSVLSHELCEIAGDPMVDRFAMDRQNVGHCQEACDAVEANTYTISVGATRVTVSDFLLPSWFDQYGKAPFSWCEAHGYHQGITGYPPGPFTVASGGYDIIFKNGRYSNVFGADVDLELHAAQHWQPGSRTALRMGHVDLNRARSFHASEPDTVGPA